MARKRFGRTIITDGAAREFQFAAHVAGSDHADLCGDCQSPVMVALTGLRSKELAWLDMLTDATSWPGTDFAPGVGWIGDPHDRTMSHYGRVRNVDIAVRCRKCPACLKARAALWRRRMVAETASANRTWFITLTVDPARQSYCRNLARAAIAEQGLWFDNLAPDDRFNQQCKPLIEEYQRFMKRLRKRSGASVRYCLVVERHKSGDPHLHLLLHEVEGNVRWRDIDGCWTWGFHKSNLVQAEDAQAAANYAAKYLTKSAANRIRASRHYGTTADARVAPSRLVF